MRSCMPIILTLMATSDLCLGITYNEFRSLLDRTQPSSIDELISELPEDYRYSYTLVYDSSSLHYSDPINPRVIIYGDDARLVLAFSCSVNNCLDANGQPLPVEQLTRNHMITAFNNLEIISFNESTNSFEFREIHFENDSFQESPVNPAKCLACHRSDSPRPNWEHYGTWPGTYGDGGGARPGSPNETDPIEDANLEIYKSLVDDSRLRYRHLREFNRNSTSAFRYPVDKPASYYRANSALNSRLLVLNFKRIIQMMESVPGFRDYLIYSVIGLTNCRSAAGFFPDDVNSALLTQYLESLQNVADSGDYEDYGSSGNAGTIHASTFRNLISLFDLLGIDTRSWPMNRIAGFHASIAEPKRWQWLLAGLLHERYPAELGPILNEYAFSLTLNNRRYFRPSLSCSDMQNLSKRKILEHTSHEERAVFFAQPDPGTGFMSFDNFDVVQVYNRCEQCHDGASDDAPYIAFDQPQNISPELFRRITHLVSEEVESPDIRMPFRGPYLGQSQQTTFVNYFRFLQQHGH